MTLDKILEIEVKRVDQKIEQELKEAKQKTKTDTMMFCTNLIAQQIALNILAKVT